MLGGMHEEALRKLYPWIATVARRMNRDHADDLKQVGAIAAWKALESFDPSKSSSPESWAKMHAVNKMKTYISRLYGTCKDRNKPGYDLPIEDEVLDSPIRVRYNDLVYHYREIHDAIADLPEKQREYIYLRFWQQRVHAELVKHFGYNPTGLWYKRSKEILKERLAHLEGVA